MMEKEMLRWLVLSCLLIPSVGFSEPPATSASIAQPVSAAKSEPATGGSVARADAAKPGQAAQPNVLATPAAPSKTCWPELASVDHFVSPGRMLKNVHLSEKSPVLTFASGPSYAELVKLPEFKQEYLLDFWLLFDMNFTKPSEVMVPSAATLDKDFCVIEDLQELKFSFESSFWSGTANEKSHLPIRSDQTKYVLVYTDARHVNDTVRMETIGLIPVKKNIRRAEKGYVMVRLSK
jgi:hypothetical protein